MTSSSQNLAGLRILVAEDEYLLADEMTAALEDAGAEVLGPLPNMRHALDLLVGPDPIDGAVIDINLQGVQAFDLADALVARGIPFVIATGYEQIALPDHLRSVPRCVKPFDMPALVQVLRLELDSDAVETSGLS